MRLPVPLASLVVLVILWPSLVLGQQRAGVVTTLEGYVTAARVTIPQPVVLKFKDDVYRDDRITTGDRALARLLLGGKAAVTVRERSVVTITEVPGKSTIGLIEGKIGLAVAKQRMRPGESIEIKTPNAVCAVRGTVLVAEVERRTAQAGGGVPGVVTHFYILRGAVEAFRLAPGTSAPLGGPLAVNTLQSFTAAGSAPPRIDNILPGQLAQIIDGLTPSGLQHASGTTDQIVNDQYSAANWLGTTIVNPGCCPIPRTTQPTPTGSPTALETPTTPSDGSGPPPSGPGGSPPSGGPGSAPPPSSGPGGGSPPPAPPPSIPPPPPIDGKLRGLDRADQVAGDNGRQGRTNAREKQAR